MHPILEDYQKAVGRLEEVLGVAKNEIQRDSAIKRFEMCFDLAWKAIKAFARDEGVECASPRACIKVAYQLRLIDYDKDWLLMIEDRNATAHTYREEVAEMVYAHLAEHLGRFKKLNEQMRQK